MKRKVEYFVYNKQQLKDSDNLETKLQELRKANHYHYVNTPDGRLLTLKDTEVNNNKDQSLKIECVHLLILTPPSGLLNGLFFIIQNFHLHEKLDALHANFEGSQIIDHLQYSDKCRTILKTMLNALEEKKKQLEFELWEVRFRLTMLEAAFKLNSDN